MSNTITSLNWPVDAYSAFTGIEHEFEHCTDTRRVCRYTRLNDSNTARPRAVDLRRVYRARESAPRLQRKRGSGDNEATGAATGTTVLKVTLSGEPGRKKPTTCRVFATV